MDLTKYYSMPIRQLSIATGVGVTTLYGLDRAKEIETYTNGKSRMIIVASFLAYVERCQRRRENASAGRSENASRAQAFSGHAKLSFPV
jgi:hypothetical protein